MTRLLPASATNRRPCATAIAVRPAHAGGSGGVAGILIARDEIRFAEHQVRRRAVARRDAVPFQDAAIAGVGDVKRAVRNRHAVAPVEGVGRSRRRSTVGQAAREILLPQDDIGRLVGSGRKTMPDEDAMVPRIGDGEHAVTCCDAGRDVECCRTDVALGVASFRCKIGLTDDEIGRRPIQLRNAVPDQKAMMAGVANEKRTLR